MRQAIYAWDYLEWGGAQIYLFGIIREAKKHFRVSVVLPEGSDPKLLSYIDDLGVDCYFFRGASDTTPRSGIMGRIRSRIRKINAEYRMMQKIAELRPDGIVHLGLLPHYSLLPLIWACLFAEVFISSHNPLPAFSGLRGAIWKLKCAVISRFRNFHVLCSNEDARNYFSRQYAKRTADDIKIAYTSVDPEEITPVAGDEMNRWRYRDRLGIGPDEGVFLCVANFIDRKGRWVFLEAARIASREDASIRFVWLSPLAPDEAAVERIVSFELGNRFRLVLANEIGRERADVLGFFMLADVFVLPSFVEGLPGALLEAMALGLPVISTNVNAIPEAVLHEKTGLLVRPGNARELADAMLRLVSDEKLAGQISSAGKQLVSDKFDVRVVALNVIDTYRSALGLI